MSDIRVTINGQEFMLEPGQTILEVCQANGIHVPTLCHYEGLKDIGACRLCIVEIQGQRRPVPACTTPAEDEHGRPHAHAAAGGPAAPDAGADLRRAEPHLPVLPAQRQLRAADRRRTSTSMDHVRYDYLFPQLPVDNSHPHIALDHNRCILCSRCIRACDQWVGAHVLDLDHRGSAAMLIADEGVPLGESSCVSCGTCVTVCPTGALFEKRSAHWQGRLPLELTADDLPELRRRLPDQRLRAAPPDRQRDARPAGRTATASCATAAGSGWSIPSAAAPRRSGPSAAASGSSAR